MAMPLLGFALLGLLSGKAQTGYELRKLFVSTPMRHFSDSPGSVYPALRRLEESRYVRAARGAKDNPRGARPYAITARGTAVFRAWLAAPVDDGDVDRPETFLLRFSFMQPLLSREQVVELAGSFEAKTRAYAGYLRDVRAAMNDAVPLSARLALENGICVYESHADWAAHALQLLKKERSP